MNIRYCLISFIILINFHLFASAQQKVVSLTPEKPQIDYSSQPVWIQMMDDPATNYYEALKAFDQYWQNRLMPIEEEELMGEEENKAEEQHHETVKRQLKKMTPAEKNEYDLMAYECKRFKDWKRTVFPYVQEDGRILTMEARQAIFDKQQLELKHK